MSLVYVKAHLVYSSDELFIFPHVSPLHLRIGHYYHQAKCYDRIFDDLLPDLFGFGQFAVFFCV